MVCRANRARRSSGPVRIRALAWLIVRVRSRMAPRLAIISARIASTAPSRPFGAPRARPDWAAGRADRVQRVGLALPAAVLAVGAVDLDDPDACCGDVAGQAGAVAAGPFDPDQADRPEPAQPAKQAGVSGRAGRELLHAEQSPDGIQRGGNVHVGVSVHAAGNGACFSASLYDGHSHPFLRLRDGTHPLAAGPVKPWPLIQARQIRPAAPVGARKTGTRPTDRFTRQPERRQRNRRSGRDPGSRPYAPIPSTSGKPRRKHYPHSPCRLFSRCAGGLWPARRCI